MKRILKNCFFLLVLTLFGQGIFGQNQAQSSPADSRLNNYEQAYQSIVAMLEGKTPVSFKSAVYATENAFLEGQLNRDDFEDELNSLQSFCRLLIDQRKLDYGESDSEQVKIHAAIFALLKDTIPLMVGADTLNKNPYQYDFEDFSGRLDWAKMFVSKLLASESGNCHSFPYLYKILADHLGAKVWLSLAPNHIYLRARNRKNNWYNTELTSGQFPYDGWIMTSGFIHLDAIKNSLYMDTLTEAQSIALTLIDLAQGYEKKFGVYGPTSDLGVSADSAHGGGAPDAADFQTKNNFILKACDKALNYFPNYVNALLLKAETERKLLFARKGWLDDAAKIDPSDLEVKELQKQYQALHDLGYRRMPDEMYLDWLFSINDKTGLLNDEVVKYRPPPSHQPANPFAQFDYQAQTLTLSGGKYMESEGEDSLVRIGSVIINLNTFEIVGFVVTDTLYPEHSLEPQIISRWMSPDPLAAEFPGWSPYNFTINNPILLIDPDGRLPIFPKNIWISLRVFTYDADIYGALVGSNNTSIHHLNEWARGRNPGSRNNLLGAVGEANAMESIRNNLPGLYYNMYFKNDISFGKTYHGMQIDIMHTIETGKRGDESGIFPGAIGMYLTISNNFDGSLKMPTILEGENTWNLLYEVKTINPYGSTRHNYSNLVDGIEKAIARGKGSKNDIGILFTDKSTWQNVANDPVYGPKLLEKYNELINTGNQLRLEDGLYEESRSELHDLGSRVKKMDE